MSINRQSLEFLIENFTRNSREWYKEHREQYKQYVETPMLELAKQIMPTILEIDPLITSDPRRCLSRIWLDMRINRSGMYFRDHMWLSFRRGKGMAYPAFYFEISPRGFGYGVGFYTMPTPVLQLLREWVLTDDKRYLDAQKAIDALPEFHVSGDEYKRKKYPDAPSKKQNWLNRKSLSVIFEGNDADLLFSENLGDKISNAFEALSPIYHFFLEAYLTGNV